MDAASAVNATAPEHGNGKAYLRWHAAESSRRTTIQFALRPQFGITLSFKDSPCPSKNWIEKKIASPTHSENRMWYKRGRGETDIRNDSIPENRHLIILSEPLVLGYSKPKVDFWNVWCLRWLFTREKKADFEWQKRLRRWIIKIKKVSDLNIVMRRNLIKEDTPWVYSLREKENFRTENQKKGRRNENGNICTLSQQ